MLRIPSTHLDMHTMCLLCQVQDELGQYSITADKVTVTKSAARASERIANLATGATVNVLEIVQMSEIYRVRARIEVPEGWINLLRAWERL